MRYACFFAPLSLLVGTPKDMHVCRMFKRIARQNGRNFVIIVNKKVETQKKKRFFLASLWVFEKCIQITGAESVGLGQSPMTTRRLYVP